LIGGTPGDAVGTLGITVLSNGNYVVLSPKWTGGGAATWGSGTAGVTGTVSAANSLIGSDPKSGVGSYVTALSHGNYVVGRPYWNNGRGAATWGTGSVGLTGTVSPANSLTGSNPNDYVGFSVTPLREGNYVVRSTDWSNKRGAVTWASGASGQTLDGLSTITP